MSRRLPPLNALRAFEAAARHLSFTKAAGELHVTQAAISHQVKALEGWLGMALFHRINRGLRLTAEGQAYLQPLRDSFDSIDAATVRLLRVDAPRRLTVNTLDSFAAGWLVPRLRGFREAHPEIEVRVTTADEIVDITRSDHDMAIRYGIGPWPGLHTVRLFDEEIYPVCSPKLIADGKPLREAADLARHTLLHDDMTVNWRMWLRAAGVEGVDPERGPFYAHSFLVIQAAVNGEGVALGRSRLVSSEIAAGRLVKPFELSLPATFSYFMVTPEGEQDRPKVVAFREWLLAQVARDEGSIEAVTPGGAPAGEPFTPAP
ncbi:MAG: transcriptional regulator GcvA [Alphaproteobacteria bacterium]